MIIDKELTAPQGAMYNMMHNRVPFPLFVGGYGCGKSEILVTNVIRDVMLFHGCRVGCYAPTYDLLDLNLVPRIEEWMDKLGIKHKMNQSKHVMTVEGDRQIYFRSMDNPARIVAYEVYASHVDEADLMVSVKKGDEAWNRIISRNRQLFLNPDKQYNKNGNPNLHKDHFNMVSAYTTPEGYKFTYNRWKKSPGKGYKYVTAPSSSNWNLDKAFIDNLKDSYTPEQCRAYLDGKWTNIFSGSVYSYFDREKHHTDRILRTDEPIFVSCDFNYGGSCTSIYVPKTVADVENVSITEFIKSCTNTNGRITKEDQKEIARLSENVGLIMVDEFTTNDTEQTVEVLKGNYGGRHISIFPDASGKANSSNASQSDIAMFKQAGFTIKARSTNPLIVDRVNSVQRLLYNGLFDINTKMCPKTTSSMEEHAYSEKTGLPEKISGPATIDDRNDAMGYCPAFLYPIRKVTTKMMEI